MEYSQNATLVFVSAYSIYVFIGKMTIPLSTRLYQQRYLFWLRRRDIGIFLKNAEARDPMGAKHLRVIFLRQVLKSHLRCPKVAMAYATTFDRCASLCSLHPPPAALATSPNEHARRPQNPMEGMRSFRRIWGTPLRFVSPSAFSRENAYDKFKSLHLLQT